MLKAALAFFYISVQRYLNATTVRPDVRRFLEVYPAFLRMVEEKIAAEFGAAAALLLRSYMTGTRRYLNNLTSSGICRERFAISP